MVAIVIIVLIVGIAIGINIGRERVLRQLAESERQKMRGAVGLQRRRR